MPVTDTDITELKRSYETQIKSLETQISVLSTSIDRLKTKKEVLDELTSSKRTSDEGPALLGKYSELNITAAVFAAVSDAAAPLTGGEIAGAMIDEGFKPNGKHWKTGVHTACRRFCGRGKFVETTKNGQKAYSLMIQR